MQNFSYGGTALSALHCHIPVALFTIEPLLSGHCACCEILFSFVMKKEFSKAYPVYLFDNRLGHERRKGNLA